MNYKSFLQNPYFKSLGRIATGVGLAFVLYQFALNFATGDCQTFHHEIRVQGPWMLLTILASLMAASILGIPLALVSMAAGILTGPIIGAPLASISLSMAAIVSWFLGRYLFRRQPIPQSIERFLHSKWYDTMMNDRSLSGFHWTVSHGLHAPIPYSLFALLVGSRVPHLSLPSFIAGVFVGSVLQVAGYALAGASIGCAVINHALGLGITQYRTLIVVSCLILILLSRLKTTNTERA